MTKKTSEAYYKFRYFFDLSGKCSLYDATKCFLTDVYHGGKDNPKIGEEAESLKSYFRKKINEDIERYNRRKGFLRFEWDVEKEDFLIGAGCESPTDDEFLRENNKDNTNKPENRKHIMRAST